MFKDWNQETRIHDIGMMCKKMHVKKQKSKLKTFCVKCGTIQQLKLPGLLTANTHIHFYSTYSSYGKFLISNWQSVNDVALFTVTQLLSDDSCIRGGLNVSTRGKVIQVMHLHLEHVIPGDQLANISLPLLLSQPFSYKVEDTLCNSHTACCLLIQTF